MVLLVAQFRAEKVIGGGIIDQAISIIAMHWLKLNLDSVKRKLAGYLAGKVCDR